jgi:hypothetical protein
MWTIDFSVRASKWAFIDVRKRRCTRPQSMPDVFYTAVVAVGRSILALSITGELYACDIYKTQWVNVDVPSARIAGMHRGSARGCDRAKLAAVEVEGSVFFFGGFQKGQEGQEDIQHSESASELNLSGGGAWTVLPPMPVWGHACAFPLDDIDISQHLAA